MPQLINLEEERFRREVADSSEPVFHLSRALHRLGNLETVQAAKKIRPPGADAAERALHGDNWDLKLRLNSATDLGDFIKLEVKGRTLKFTCVRDFPFPSVYVDRVKDGRPRPHGYATLSDDWRTGAFVRHRDDWPKETVMTRMGYRSRVLACPKAACRFETLDAFSEGFLDWLLGWR